MNGLEQLVEYIGTGLRQFPEGALRQVLIALLGFTFLWSSLAKARSPWQAAFAINDFGISRQPRVRFAWTLITVELCLAVMLLVSPAISSSFIGLATGMASGVFLLFSGLITRALLLDRSFPCACFGSQAEQVTHTTLIRSGALGLVATACFIAGPIGQTLGFGDLVLVWCSAVALLAMGMLIIRLRQLIRLPSPLEPVPS